MFFVIKSGLQKEGFMKSKRIILIFLIFFLFINNCSIINPVDIEKKNRMISQIITYALNNFHYTDKELNNDLSDEIFNEFFSYIDYGKRYFLQSDIDKFRKNKEYFDNYFLDGNYNYIYEIFDTFLIRVKEGRNITEEILSKPLDFDKEEKVQLDGKKREYCKNRKELKEYWRKYLKYRTVLRYFDIIEERKNKDEKTDIDYSSIEKEARKRVKKAMDQFFKRLLDFDKKEQFDIYVNTVTRIFDTHSSYFSPYEKENFDLEMSGKFEGIGAVLSESEGNVKVVRIVPGGPAWKEGNLEAEDVILKVKPGKEEDFQSLLGLGVDDAVKLIRGKKGKPVILTVRKPDGRIKDITIVRDVVTLEETYAKSSILQLKNKNRKIGYIKLPKFYHDFNDSKGRRSSDDVKNQIEYLKDNGIEGLILDLRNNSGGALRDAIKTAGLFIEDGPIVQVRGRSGKISVLRDLNKNIIYEKPLIILINKFSASASEIVAAALRDYGRAVIVGSEQSYGKGTVQNMIRLDDLLSSKYEKFSPLGALKITTQKFYRVSGKSTQVKGVSSDIVLPDLFSGMEIGEGENEYSLPWDTIKSANYDKNNSIDKIDIGVIKQKSRNRVNKDLNFKIIQNYSKFVEQNRGKTEVSLNINKREKRHEEIQKLIDRYEDINYKDTIEIVDKAEKTSTEENKEKYQRYFETIYSDIYLYETLNIMNDIIIEQK